MTLETIDPKRLATTVGGTSQMPVDPRLRDRYQQLLRIEQAARLGGGLGTP